MLEMYQRYLDARAESKRKEILIHLKRTNRKALTVRPNQLIVHKLIVAQLRLSGSKRDRAISSSIVRDALGLNSPPTSPAFRTIFGKLYKQQQLLTPQLPSLILKNRLLDTDSAASDLGTLHSLPMDIRDIIATHL